MTPDAPAQASNQDGNFWCCVVERPEGKIPGKAIEGTAWYTSGGIEY